MKKILNGPRVYRAKCHLCDCEFEYGDEDVVNNQLNPKPEETDKFVVCPGCGCYIEHWGNPYSNTSTNREHIDTIYS